MSTSPLPPAPGTGASDASSHRPPLPPAVPSRAASSATSGSTSPLISPTWLDSTLFPAKSGGEVSGTLAAPLAPVPFGTKPSSDTDDAALVFPNTTLSLDSSLVGNHLVTAAQPPPSPPIVALRHARRARASSLSGTPTEPQASPLLAPGSPWFPATPLSRRDRRGSTSSLPVGFTGTTRLVSYTKLGPIFEDPTTHKLTVVKFKRYHVVRVMDLRAPVPPSKDKPRTSTIMTRYTTVHEVPSATGGRPHLVKLRKLHVWTVKTALREDASPRMSALRRRRSSVCSVTTPLLRSVGGVAMIEHINNDGPGCPPSPFTL